MLKLEQNNSKLVIKLTVNGRERAIGYISHGKYIKHIRPYMHTMQKTNEFGINREVVDTIPFSEVEIHLGKEIYTLPKEEVQALGRIDHYLFYEEQYFIDKGRFYHDTFSDKDTDSPVPDGTHQQVGR